VTLFSNILLASMFPAPIVGKGFGAPLIYLVCGLGMVVIVGLLGLMVFWGLRQPLRQREQARLLLDIMETALARGEPVERALTLLSVNGECSMGRGLHRLAFHIENGMKLVPALEKVPSLLPDRVMAMLRVGEELGDIRKVLPACRLALKDAVCQSQASVNYQMVFAVMAHPAIVLGASVAGSKVLEVFMEIYRGNGLEMPSKVLLGMQWMPVIATMQVLAVLVVYFFGTSFIGGTGMSGWLDRHFPRMFDAVGSWFPWRRLRVQRDFVTLLGLLLDAGVREERALALAGEGTASPGFERRVRRAGELLRAGTKLPEVVRTLDSKDELGWRLENAFHGRRPGGFFAALNGWRESLDARAFQKQQAGAQCLSTVLLFMNALLVAACAAGVFEVVTKMSILPH
jgi:type II secretory pathway component PulF